MSARGRFGDEEVRKSDLVDVAMVRFGETERAILAGETADRKDAVWLPKSLIEVANDGHKNFVTVTMPEWLAMKNGLI